MNRLLWHFPQEPLFFLCIFHQSCLSQGDLLIINNRDNAANDPTGWIAHSNGNDFVADSGHTEQIYLSEQNKGAEHDEHTGFAVTSASKCAGVYLIKATQNIKRCKHTKEQCTVSDDLRFVVKESHNGWSKYHNRYHHNCGRRHGNDNGNGDTFSSAMYLIFAKVLSHKCCSCQGYGLHGQE